MKILITPALFIIFFTSCTAKEARPDGNWTKSTNLSLLKNITHNNNLLKSFKARFYLTENVKRMALSGNIFFDRENKNFSLTLRDVLVSSDILTMKKNSNRLLIHFHRDNKKYLENVNTVKLSNYAFAIELDELIKFISLEIPLLITENVYEQTKGDTIIYKLIDDTKEQIVYINLKTKKALKIDFKKNNQDYSIQYSSYESNNNFYYPETAKIINYSEKQRVLIKVEKIDFVDNLSNDIFKF